MPAIIPAAIMAGGAIGGAIISSRAASKAVNAQKEAAQESIALQKDIYQQQRADLAPYRQQGAQAVNTLGGLMGFSGGAAQAGPFDQQAQAQTPSMGRQRSPNAVETGHTAVPRPTLATMGGMPGPQTDVPQGDPGAAQMRSQFARVQAPDGQVYNVPAGALEQALAQGGRRVG